jgi:hypothetical protein
MSLYRVRKKAITDDGNFSTQHARQITLAQGQETTIIDFITEPDKSWSLYIFANSQDGKDVTILQKQRGAGFGTSGTIKYSVGGFENGQLISGTGSVTISGIANGSDNILSVYFVEQVYAEIIPPLSQTLSIGSAGDTLDVGYPPFSRYFVNVYSNSGFQVKFLSNTSVELFGYTLNQGTDKLFLQGFFHPPACRLNIVANIDSQTFVITHYQKK